MVKAGGGRLFFTFLGLLFLAGCQSSGAGAYIGRQEFDSLSRRVGALEQRVGISGDLAQLASSSSGALLPPPGADLNSPAGTGTAAAPASGSEKSLYQKGQSLLKQKKYDQAASIFSQMLARNPGGRLAPNARYWLGESYYARGRYQEAAAEFQRCAADYPNSDKAPDALLKLSYSHDRLGDGPQAMLVMDELLSRYPRSNAADLVKSGRVRFSG
ncbi:MAG: tol-pal system protein YbgF [Candidatus Adiutrix sp.]|jgi:tol-pal system protein YbgF|nr:tol-pal system protein YbgF [Candidatus Adiutrix sp.]